jgi:hypothetical protein
MEAFEATLRADLAAGLDVPPMLLARANAVIE